MGHSGHPGKPLPYPALRWLPEAYTEHAPAPATARAIECVWTSRSIRPQRVAVLADGCVDLLLRGQLDGTGRIRDLSFEIVGAMTGARQIDVAEHAFFIGVRFRPGFASHLVTSPLHEFTDRQAPLAASIGAAADALARELLHTENPDALTPLMQRLCEPTLHATDRVQLAIDAYVRSNGTMPIDDLHNTAHLGERQFRRSCLHRTGLAPKRLGQVLRVRRVTELLHGSPSTRLSMLAQSLGYADQAHMTREVRLISGRTPTMLRPAADDRFVQDAARGVK